MPHMICRGSQEKEDISGLPRISVARVKCTKTQGDEKQSKTSKLNKKEYETKLQLAQNTLPRAGT
jgi:hypothetical protein